MKFLLKILRGANAGAEIELAEGAVLFGSADSCDIVLADAAVPPEAFVLETSDTGVTCKILPDGEARKVDLYTLQSVAGTSFAVGEAGAPWHEIREPAPAKPDEEKPAEERPAEEKPAEEPPAPAQTPNRQPEEPQPKRGRTGGCLLMLLCFVVGFVLAVVLYALFGAETLASQEGGWRSAWENLSRKWRKSPARTVVEKNIPSLPTLEEWAEKNGLTVEEKDGVKTISGNFAKRSEKLDAVEMAYRLAPQAVVDISDDETLRSGVEAVLFTITENRIELRDASNRKVVLAGKAKSKDELLHTVAALCTDVNHVRIVDDTAVVCEDGARTVEPTVYRPVAEDKKKDPEFPVTGIITTPYPCLLLKDGSRASVGAMIGKYRVDKIEPEQVTLTDGEEKIVWKP